MQRGGFAWPPSGLAAVWLQGVSGSIFTGMKNFASTRFKTYKAIVSSKFNQARIDGEPYDSSGPPFTQGAVHGHDEFTKHQWLLLLRGFHDTKLGQANMRRYGALPGQGFLRIRRSLHSRGSGRGLNWSQKKPTECVGVIDGQLNPGRGSGIVTTVNHQLAAGFANWAAVRYARGHRRPCAERLPPFPTTARRNTA